MEATISVSFSISTFEFKILSPIFNSPFSSISPSRVKSKVLLPEPDGPLIAIDSPGLNLKVKSCKNSFLVSLLEAISSILWAAALP